MFIDKFINLFSANKEKEVEHADTDTSKVSITDTTETNTPNTEPLISCKYSIELICSDMVTFIKALQNKIIWYNKEVNLAILDEEVSKILRKIWDDIGYQFLHPEVCKDKDPQAMMSGIVLSPAIVIFIKLPLHTVPRMYEDINTLKMHIKIYASNINILTDVLTDLMEAYPETVLSVIREDFTIIDIEHLRKDTSNVIFRI